MADISINEADALFDRNEFWREPEEDRMFSVPPSKRLVAEGDSWFDYVPFNFTREKDIVDWLATAYNFKIARVVDGGDTLENMIYGTEHKLLKRFPYWRPKPNQLQETLQKIQKYDPVAVVFSGGGNDLTGTELETFLNHKTSNRPTALRNAYVNSLFDYYEDMLLYFVDEILKVSPKIKILAHGYAHPYPDGRGVFRLPKFIRKRRFWAGPWLAPAFAQKRVQYHEARRIMIDLINRFNAMLGRVEAKSPKNAFGYVDLRSTIKFHRDWENELHPKSHIFRKMAAEFHKHIP